MGKSGYKPEDAGISAADVRALAEAGGVAVRDAVAALKNPAAPTVADVANLRKEFSQEILHAALTMSSFQKKARAKFPGATFIYGTPEALEQSSGAVVAQHKASRFRVAAAKEIVDLCAGIGGDALALADVAPVLAVDLSETRLACLECNAESFEPAPRFPIRTVVGDVSDHLPSLPREAFFHIDPARRSSGSRSPKYEDLIPGPEVIYRVMAHFSGGAIKLSPAVDFDSLPTGHLELISQDGVVVQAVVWVGKLASLFEPGIRTATVITGNNIWSFAGAPAPPSLMPPETFEAATTLYELDGALTRAGLSGPFAKQHQMIALTADGGYLVSIASGLATHWPCLTAFHVHGIYPYSEQRITDELGRLPSPEAKGPVEVKCRGHLPQIDTDRLQLIWTRAAPFGRTVLIFRQQKTVWAAIATCA